jgi:hypothetical protein
LRRETVLPQTESPFFWKEIKQDDFNKRLRSAASICNRSLYRETRHAPDSSLISHDNPIRDVTSVTSLEGDPCSRPSFDDRFIVDARRRAGPALRGVRARAISYKASDSTYNPRSRAYRKRFQWSSAGLPASGRCVMVASYG